MKYNCPVCFYDQMPYPPHGYNICPCCGTEFDNDDLDATHEELRLQWLRGGMRWFFRTPPDGWNPLTQALLAGYVPAIYKAEPLATMSEDSFTSFSNFPYWTNDGARPMNVQFA